MEQDKNKQFLFKSGGWLLVALTVLSIVAIISLGRGWRYIGVGIAPTNVFSVSAQASIDAKPTGGTITFTQRNDAKTVKEAEEKRNVVVAKALDAIKLLGINEKDIKTTSINHMEKYDIPQPCVSGYCPNQSTKVVGYDAYQSITIKVRDTENLSKVVDTLRDAGVTQVDGPSFGFEDEEIEKFKAQAREDAIAKAKVKAELLAKQLGVEIVRVVSFYENDPNAPQVAYKSMDSRMGASMAESVIPVGEDKISSSITITYEIR